MRRRAPGLAVSVVLGAMPGIAATQGAWGLGDVCTAKYTKRGFVSIGNLLTLGGHGTNGPKKDEYQGTK